MLDFVQADGYARRVSYLNKLELPKGSIDFGRDIPAHDVYLIGPTVEILARDELHPVLCDLLLEAALDVQGRDLVLRARQRRERLVDHRRLEAAGGNERKGEDGAHVLHRTMEPCSPG